MKRLLLYYGNTLVGDINKFAKNRRLEETLKSEASQPTADSFSFSINWKLFSDFVKTRFDDPPETFLKVLKTRVVFEVGGLPRFAGFLSARPAREGLGNDQSLTLTFYEHFARLSGDVVCDPLDPTSPMRSFENVRADVFVETLVGEFLDRAEAAGDALDWEMGNVDRLANKTITYKDFPTIAKALCDAMNNVEGAGKFDVVVRPDPEDYSAFLVDVLKPRGRRKNVVIQYPGDGVYKLWASGYSVAENNEFASEIIVAGSGQVGDTEEGEQTAKIGTATNATFAANYGYYKIYEPASNLYSQDAVDQHAATRIEQLDIRQETPELQLVGRPIAWGDADNLDNGLAVGDTFYFSEETDDGGDRSGYYRIIAMTTTYDDNGVETVNPTLKAVDE